MQLTIHDAHLKKVAFIDNEKPKTLNFYDDTWTRNLQTGSSTYEFSISKKQLVSDTVLNRTYNYLNERSFVSFEYKGKTYLFNVMTVEEDEKKIKCYCENLNLELINEYSNAYEADRAMTFVEYCNAMDLLNMTKLSIGINEISDYKRTLKWEGQDTKLARLISLANKFDAEIDFETFLNADSTIKSFLVNVYHENDGNYHGVGRVRKDITLVYGKNLKSIKRKIDKTGIFNMTVPSSSDTVEDEPIDTGESSAKTVVTKNADGSVTKTTTKKASDGTTVQTKVTTKVVDNADGSRVTTVRTEKSNGLITEKVTTRDANGNTDTQTKTIREATSETAETVDEHITLSGLPDWEIKNDSGVVEFYKRGEALYAPISAQLYPSTFTSDTQGDQWIRRDLTFDVETDTQLQTEALKQLKAAAYPELTYEFDGYIDADIGDTVQISDSGFTNMLLLEARIFEQKLSFSSKKNWKTTLGNFKALQNMLSSDIQAELEKLVDDAKPYTIRVSSDNGITFKNGEGESLIKATLWKGNKVLDADVTWRWALDGNVTVGMQYLVKASSINDTAVLTVSAYIGNNEVATTEITLTNVNDGADGAKGDKGDDGAKGDKGETGNGIANTVITYGLSTSETTEPATWASNMPVLVKGMYLWTRTVQIYTNGTSSTSYQKGYIAKDGAQGLPGTPGKDAQTQYTHIAYADNATGGGFSLTDNTKAYWGMYQDFNAANSNDPTKYKWSKWKGDQGLPGKPGADGKTPYVHFAYADDNKGTNLSFTDKNQQYQGYYSDYTEANSTDYKKYTWVDRLANVQVGGRNLAQKTSKDWSTPYTNFKGIANTCPNLYKVLVDGLSVGDTLKSRIVLKYTDIVPTSGQTSTIWLQGSGNVSGWNAGSYNGSSKKTISGSGEVVFEHEFKITADHLKNEYWNWQFRTDYIASGSLQWKLAKVEKGTVFSDWSPALEDTQEQIDSKADSALTQEQLNALEAKRLQMEVELKAKATLEQVSELETFINNLKQEDSDGRQKIIEITKAIEERVKDIEPIMEYSQKLKFMDTYITQGNGGMIIGANDSTTKVVVTPDRISFQSGGSEVAYISQRMLHIDNGVFTMSLQLGHYITRAHPKNEYVNATYFVK
ncbi:antireceptor [Streptococcus gallolyticus]|uniref:antireceptor n=1 Tax=Streptococcus gallolyticus TaxID=315405 RepID=UPI0022839E88|nr:antireceptor [Streptococcus gallolyticus]MCY7156271.1 antireceptor [Streptococcus gallolyticus subsp. gallolyticus]